MEYNIIEDIKMANSLIREMNEHINNEKIFPYDLTEQAKGTIYILENWETNSEEYKELVEKTIELIKVQLEVDKNNIKIRDAENKLFKQVEEQRRFKAPSK